MSAIQLHFSTGDPTIDRVMRGYTAAFQAAFPGRLRCVTLAGGYAEGTATPLSDIDGGPVFRAGTLTHDEWLRAEALIRACSDLARIHLDAGAGVDTVLHPWRESGDIWVTRSAVERRYGTKLTHRIIWGEDFRDPILLPPIEYWARLCFSGPHHMGSAAYFIAAARHPERATSPDDFSLTYPVGYPQLDDEYFGYARHPLTARDGTVHLTTRTLVRTILAGAAAMLAWKAKHFIASKADVAAAYRGHIGGPWADLIDQVDRTCRIELSYLTPPDSAHQHRLRTLCAEVPAFENFILEQLRAFVLEQLHLTEDESVSLPDGDWIPTELAGWLLERSPDDVHTLGASGTLPTRIEVDRTQFAARPCIQHWATTTLGRVHFRGDRTVLNTPTRR